jgi:hypothetical protein
MWIVNNKSYCFPHARNLKPFKDWEKQIFLNVVDSLDEEEDESEYSDYHNHT